MIEPRFDTASRWHLETEDFAPGTACVVVPGDPPELHYYEQPGGRRVVSDLMHWHPTGQINVYGRRLTASDRHHYEAAVKMAHGWPLVVHTHGWRARWLVAWALWWLRYPLAWLAQRLAR